MPEVRSPRRSAPLTSGASGRSRGAWPSSTWRRLPTLLFEIGCEELPAAACEEAAAQLRLELARLGSGSVFAGPRRLAILVDDLPEREPDEWVKGPPEHLREK